MLTDGQSSLVGVFTQALLYGIYFATLIQCLRWLIFTDEGWKRRERINPFMALATIFIFLTSTIPLVTSLIYHINEYTRTEYWDQYGTVMAANISEILAVIAIDIVLIYRCWVVYAKSWRVICAPVTCWLASLACSVLQSYYAGLNYKNQTYSLEIAQISIKALTGLYACNIAITIYTTTAIIYRIMSKRYISGGNPRRLNYVMRILAESGILYTSMLIFRLVGALPMIGNDPTWVEVLISGISDPIGFSTGGISFNLILIRVYQSRVELRDSLADSRHVYGERTLSQIQVDNPQIAASSESNALDETVDEIQEHRRTHDGMHEN